MIILSRSSHDLAMILTSVPCIMICHDLDNGTMVNHDIARFTMIMARVPWLRTLGGEIAVKFLKKNGRNNHSKFSTRFRKNILKADLMELSGSQTKSKMQLLNVIENLQKKSTIPRMKTDGIQIGKKHLKLGMRKNLTSKNLGLILRPEQLSRHLKDISEKDNLNQCHLIRYC